jgi:hypothetical protein
MVPLLAVVPCQALYESLGCFIEALASVKYHVQVMLLLLDHLVLCLLLMEL